jgi:RNA polymerase sigma-B factor
MLNTPVLGTVVARFALVRFTRMLGTLVGAGVPLIASLRTAREALGNDTLADTVGDEEAGYDRAEERATIAWLMRSISPREREVLRLRFEEDLTQAEIGEIIGVSQMQVSRLIRQAVARLRLAASADAAPAGPHDR